MAWYCGGALNQPPPLRIVSLAGLALTAFAANSVLARLALGGGAIDAATYTSVRMVSGAMVLGLLLRTREGRAPSGGWIPALLLALYAAPFSFAYLQLSAGTGALILFGSVQTTMIVAGLRGGERPHAREWVGLALALAGLVWLVLPGVDRAPPLGAGLMIVAGIAWGGYSLRGRRAGAPLPDTTGNFIRSVPVVLVVSAATWSDAHWSPAGLLWATLAGGVASGVGYVIWYTVLPGLTATRAATIQLLVPVLAAWAGVVLLGEQVTLRLALAGATILGGVGLAVGIVGGNARR